MAVLVLAVSGCAGDDSRDAAGSEFADFAEVVDVIDSLTLEEPTGQPIIGIDDLTVLRDGRLVIVDGKAGQARLHERDGAFVAVVSREGRGPGEFRRPLRVTSLPEGGFVLTGASPKISIFDEDGAWVRDVSTPGLGAVELEAVDQEHVLLASATASSATFMTVNLEDGSSTVVHERDPKFATNEEWRVAVRDHAAVWNDSALIAASLEYPLVRIDLRTGDRSTFGEQPASWIQASRPEPSTQVMQRLPGWLVSFTFISGVWVVAGPTDIVLVQHGGFAESESARLSTLFAWEPRTVDLYNTDGDRLLEDLRTDSRVLAADDSVIYAVVESPPESWIISRSRLDEAELSSLSSR
jgi:hypothetical protein